MIIPIFSKTIFLRYTLIEWDTWWVNYNSPENWRRFNSQGCWNFIGDHNATSWPLMTFNLIQSIFFTLSQGLHSSFWGFKWFMWAEKGERGGGHRCRSFLHARDEVYAPHAIAECATTLSHRRSQICDTSAQFLCTRPLHQRYYNNEICHSHWLYTWQY